MLIFKVKYKLLFIINIIFLIDYFFFINNFVFGAPCPTTWSSSCSFSDWCTVDGSEYGVIGTSCVHYILCKDGKKDYQTVSNSNCCGNSKCENEIGESCSTCSSDCGLCCTANGGTCTTGSQCCSGLCIEGYCRASCLGYNGQRCSNDTNAYTTTASGICARNNAGSWFCDKDEVSFYSSNYYTDCYEPFNGAPSSSFACDNDVDPSYSAVGICVYTSGTISTTTVNCDTSGDTCFDGTYYRDTCSNCYTSGLTARSCDSDGGTSYTANGICVSGGTCATGTVCYSGSAYFSAMSSCSQGNTCDSSVSNGAYVADGVVYNNDGNNICCYGTNDYETVGIGNSCCLNGGILSSGSTSGSLLCYNGEFYDCGAQISTSPDTDTDVVSGSCTSYGGYYCSGTTWTTLLPSGCSCIRGSQCISGLCIEGICRLSCNPTYNGQRCSDDGNTYFTSGGGICARNNAGSWFCDKDEVSFYSSNYYIDCYDPFNGAPSSSFTCDNDVDPSYSAVGICVYTSGTISTTTVNCDTSGDTCFDGTYYRDTCSNCYTSGSTARSCDSDGGTSYTANGICVSGGTCDNTEHACYDDNAYQSSCSLCSYDYDLDPQGDSCDTNIGDGSYTANGLCTYNDICIPIGTTIRVDIANNNYFVAGCTNGSGDRCDIDGGTTFDQTGLCTIGYICDGTDVTNVGGIYYGNCSSRGGYSCMKNANSGLFTQTGMCFDTGGLLENVNFGCTISGYIFYNGTHYKNSSQITTDDYSYVKDSDGRSCDNTLTDGNYNPTGMITMTGCTANGQLVRADKNNNYFTNGCDNSASSCGYVSSSLNSPWAKLGICCSNSCIGYADSNCCSNSDCALDLICFNNKCVGKDIAIEIKNLGLTGIEHVNNSFTSTRSVMLLLHFNSTFAVKCRYINYDDPSNMPSNDSVDWTQWETCVSTKLWELTPNEGLKTVYYQIDYGSYYKIANDSIYYNASGAGLDITPPNPPYIVDGDYTNNLTRLKIAWYNASDPESDILNIPLLYKVNAYSNGVHTNTITTTSNSYTLDISNLPLHNNSIIYVNITVINSAGLIANSISDGVIVDTQKPIGTNIDAYFYNLSNNLWTMFNYPPLTEDTYVAARNVNMTWLNKFSDAISGVDAYSYVLTKDLNTDVDEIPEGNIGNFDKEISKVFTNLGSGKYFFKIKARDKAGNWGDPITFNFSLDTTPPTIPKVVSTNYSNKFLTARWLKSVDPESDVKGYNITIYNSLYTPVASYYLASKDLETYTFDLSLYPTDNYNITVGAINFAGLISWSYQTKYSDFEPPEIIAKPNNTIVITTEPIIAVFTNEDAVCYYNNTMFKYTNTTYHETKLTLNYGDYGYKIKCYDMADNMAETEISFNIQNIEPQSIVLVSNTKYYEKLPFEIKVNLMDSSNNLLAEADVDNFKLENYNIYVYDYLNGTYGINFITPKKGNYNLNLIYKTLSLPINLEINELLLYSQYRGSVSSTMKNRVVYLENNNLIGLASEDEDLRLNSNLSLEVSYNEPLFIIMTKDSQLVNKKDRQLMDKSFSKLNTPSFGYASSDKKIIEFILSYNFPIISSDKSISLGRTNYYIKNSKENNQKYIEFLKE
ncbi:MAG: hypothetical protein QXE31_03970 [Candidatus Woesearchaeota archaeon]